jgi:hypothetical protein
MLVGRMFVRRTLEALVVSMAAAVACGRPLQSGSNSNTNWLKDCGVDSDCRGGLKCFCGKCTRHCRRDAECSTFGPSALCLSGESCGGDVCAQTEAQLSETTDTSPGSTSSSDDGSASSSDASADRIVAPGSGGTGSGGTGSGGAGSGGAIDPLFGSGGKRPVPPPSSAGGAPSAAHCAGGNSPEVIVPSGVNGMHIALSATHVYWAHQSQIWRTPKNGGTSEVVRDTGVEGRAPFIDSNRLYWGGPSFTVYGMPLDAAGASPKSLASGIADVDGWVASGDFVYFAGGPLASLDQHLAAAPASGGPTTTLVAQITLSNAIAADATGVYWYDDQRLVSGIGLIRKYTLETRQVADFAAPDVVRFLHTGGGYVIWDDVPSNGDRAVVVWSNVPGGSQPLQLGSANFVFQLTTDGTSAYYVAGPSPDAPMDIFAVPLSGGPTTSVACGVRNVYSLAVDENAVYYSTWDATGSLSKVSKR